jgi:Protein of unknown function (DUF1579)
MATGIERLHFMVGEWDIKAYSLGEQGEWVDSPLPKWTKIEPLFDGAFLQEQVVPMQIGDSTVRFFIMWSYDKYRQVYRMLACDDHDGLMDILEGNFEDGTDTMVVSNTRTNTAMLDTDGKPVHLRLSSTQTSADSFTDEMSESTDGGQSWLKVYRAEHTRK